MDDDTKLELGNTQSLKTEIAGYWKEVRTSLGLGLLPDTILFHGKVNGLDDSSHSTSTGRGNARKNVINLFSNRLYRERLGRFHPAHLRRRDIPDSEETDVSYARENIDELSLAQAWDDNIDYYDTANGQPGPEPFLAKDSELSRILSVQAHAAAFRAIAARELRQHHHHHSSNKPHGFLRS